MRTRNAGVPKTPAPPKTPVAPKRTPPARKSATKASKSTNTPPSAVVAAAADEFSPELLTPNSSAATPASEPTPSSAVEQEKASEDAVADPPTKKIAAKKKVTKTKKVIKKVLRPKTPASAKAAAAVAAAADEAVDVKSDQGQEGDDVVDAKEEHSLEVDEVSLKAVESEDQEGLGTQRDEEIGDALEKDENKMDVDDSCIVDANASAAKESPATEVVERVVEELSVSADGQEEAKCEELIKNVNDGATITTETLEPEKGPEDQINNVDDGQKLEKMDDKQEQENVDAEQEQEKMDDSLTEKPEVEQEKMDDSLTEKPEVEQEKMDDSLTEKPEVEQEKMDDSLTEKPEVEQEKMDDSLTEKPEEAAQVKEDDVPEGVEDYGDEEGFVEPGEEDLQEDEEPETADDTKSLNDESKDELAAAAKERKLKKEHEIFVGGLDREVTDEDVKKAFEMAGEVVEVRLLKDPATNKNRGFAFVRFATKDQAKKALTEMKNPTILGKQCGTAANEDNDTLFVGNICNTWTKEAINQKLKDYNLEGVENITLVQDPRHDGLSRGFCFIQFACHADAMSAYKRLQKPDAVFGHNERTVKVAFSEPLQEPDPEVMAKVKSVFVDGLPPFWDEDTVRKHFKCYGEIERVTLARNMSTAKRKDFGFVDYMTREAAIACIEDVNKKDLVDGSSKIKVRARLSNPLPKMQAVKGGMRGGFRIGRPGGRSLGRPVPPVSRPNFQHGRGSRGPFNDPVGPYVRRVPHRGGHGAPGASAVGRPSFGGPRHGMIERQPPRAIPPPLHRGSFPLDDGGYTRPYMGRPYDDPYMHNDSYGLKRPYYMTEQDPAYMEPSRVRPRYDYTNLGRGPHFRDTYGAGSNVPPPSGYYGPDYGARPHGPHPPFNPRDRSYGSGSGRGYY